ncbi:MAG: type VI secretion system protein TssA [Verrucomicrobia bacterium]|nr:type VI secretion system protein TssA [Verrucomicrobiota bacterium]
MNELVEKLLQPVSADQPCGADLSYDPRLDELETLLKGKPEVEMGSIVKPAEPPEWRMLQDKSVAFLGHSKNLRVALMLCCAWLKTGGLAGFRDGLQLVRGLLEQYWPNVYPLLDPEDNNDPTQRLNILGALTAARGSVSGWLMIVDYLYAAPICQPKGAPPITLEQLQAAKQRDAGVEGAPKDVPDPAKLAAAIRDSGTDRIVATHQAVEEALEAARGIDELLTTTLGAGNTISFEVLQSTLKELLAALNPYLPGSAGAESGPAIAGGESVEGATGGAASAGIFISGSVRSREDVVRAIDSICDYYRQVEPSSPVPYLLRRAQKLATMNFVQAMQELSLANVDALRPSMGTAIDEAAASSEAPTE